MATDFFIPRDTQKAIVDVLEQVPEACEELAVTITRQDRIGTPGPRVSRGEEAQPMPVNLEASDVAVEVLHATLVSWTRHVCESRAVEYEGGTSTPAVAQWLSRNVVSLAMTEGSEEAYDEIRHAVGQAWRAVDSRPERKRYIDEDSLDEAASLELNMRGVAAAAAEMGGEFADLTYDRVRYLRRRGLIEPVSVHQETGMELFRLGDAMAAHLTKRKKAA